MSKSMWGDKRIGIVRTVTMQLQQLQTAYAYGENAIMLRDLWKDVFDQLKELEGILENEGETK